MLFLPWSLFNFSKQCRPCWNAALCGISSGSSLFAKTKLFLLVSRLKRELTLCHVLLCMRLHLLQCRASGVGSGETVRMRRVVWAFAGCLSNEYHSYFMLAHCFLFFLLLFPLVCFLYSKHALFQLYETQIWVSSGPIVQNVKSKYWK